MRTIHSFLSCCFALLPLLAVSASATAQVQQPYSGENAVSVTVGAPGADILATFDVLPCTPSGLTPGGLSMLNPGVGHSTAIAGTIALALAAPLASGDSFCVVETFTGTGAPAVVNFPLTVVAKAAAPVGAGSPKLTIAPTYTGAKAAIVTPLPQKAGYTAKIDLYASCPPAGGAALLSSGLNDVNKNNDPIALQFISPPQKDSSFCAVESYAVIPGAGVPAIGIVSSDSAKVQDPPAPASATLTPTEKSKLALLRISGGIDVSAAASVDPAAKFLLDGAFESPLMPDKSKPKLDSHLWGSGYIRLASIASPGAVNGVSDVATYVKPLTDSTPAALVQSAEGNVALEWHFIRQGPAHSLKGEEQPSLFSAVLNAGVITPLSQSQANPTIYIVSQQLYNSYTAASTSDTVAMTAIQAACGSSFDASTPCYVAYLPQDRTRFYRNYAGGVTYKKYYYNGGATKDDDSFGFPGIATLTIGQNEYVTRGQLRGLVLHAGASWPLAGNLPVGKWAGAVYTYGAIDMNLNGKNQNTQEYLLQTAGSSVTLASNRLAAFSVKQQDRDRYRFGIGVDILKLFNK